MNLDIKDIKEYEEIIGLDYKLWTYLHKINFINWLKAKNYISKLDTFMNIYYDENYNYNQTLQEYLDLGFEIIYSKGDKENPIRSDKERVIENEKIIFQKENGIIGNITKVRQNGKVELSANNFYYETLCNLSKKDFYKIMETYNATPEDIKDLIHNRRITTPWSLPYDKISLTKRANATDQDTLDIINTFDEGTINALGYEKKEGKIYSKK